MKCPKTGELWPVSRVSAQEAQVTAVVLSKTLQALLYGAAEESDGPTGRNMQTPLD